MVLRIRLRGGTFAGYSGRDGLPLSDAGELLPEAQGDLDAGQVISRWSLPWRREVEADSNQ